MYQKLKDWWADRTPAFRASANTQWQVALGIFAPTALGFTSKVLDWAGGNGDLALDDVSILGKGVVAAAGSIVTAAITYGFRRAKPPSFDAKAQPTVAEVTR